MMAPRHCFRVEFASGASRQVYATSVDNALYLATEASRAASMSRRDDTKPVAVVDVYHVGDGREKCPLCKKGV